MKATLLALSLCASVVSHAFSDIVFNIGYEPPSFTNNQEIGGGFGATISDSINGFSSQGVLLHDGASGGLNYSSSETFTTGVHLVSWSWTVPNTTQGAGTLIGASLISSPSIEFSTYIGGNGSAIELYYGPRYPDQPHISLNLNQSYNFQVLVNLDAYTYSFWLDSTQLEDAVGIPATSALGYVDFHQDQTVGTQAGLDNFRWEIVPEPASIALLLLGSTGIYLARRHRHGKE